jgi:hypothetical protein
MAQAWFKLAESADLMDIAESVLRAARNADGFFATCPITPDPAFASIFGTPANSLTLYSGPLVDLNVLASAPAPSSLTPQFAFDLSLSAPAALDVQPLFTINVTSVPEPSTWAMMLMGFAGLGFA